MSARLSATRRDRITARLPMLRPPHPEGTLGAVRVEVRGDRDGAREIEVLGAIDRPAVAAGAVAAVAVTHVLARRRAGRGARHGRCPPRHRRPADRAGLPRREGGPLRRCEAAALIRRHGIGTVSGAGDRSAPMELEARSHSFSNPARLTAMVSELDQIAHTRLRRDGQRYTDNRRQLVGVLAESADPLTIPEILERDGPTSPRARSTATWSSSSGPASCRRS